MTHPCPIHGVPIHDQAVVCEDCGHDLARALGDVAATVHELSRPTLTSDGKLVVDAYAHGSRRSAPWDTPAGARGSLHRDLAVTRTRQARTGGGGSTRSTGERPVPFNDRATQAQAEVRAVLARWVRVVEAGRGVSPARSDSESVAGWLLGHVDWLRRHRDAERAVIEVVDVVRAAQRVIDTRPQRWYAGPCGEPLNGTVPCPCGCHESAIGTACDVPRDELQVTLADAGVEAKVPDGAGCQILHSTGVVQQCTTHLYAIPGRPMVKCPTCKAELEVQARRAWLLAAANDQLAHAAMLATAVTTLGHPVTPERIRKWKQRGRIFEHSVDHRGRPLYRVGDVLDLLAGDAVRESTRTRQDERMRA